MEDVLQECGDVGRFAMYITFLLGPWGGSCPLPLLPSNDAPDAVIGRLAII